MTTSTEIWTQLFTAADRTLILSRAMRKVGAGLSDMACQPIISGPPVIKHVPISRLAGIMGSPDAEMVGIYLRIESGLRGQALLMMPLNFALNLSDLLMELPRGKSTNLGLMERSALAEMGNLTLSYFLNALSSFAGDSEMLQPSPPVVMVDMLGAILNIIAAPAAFIGDSLLVIETIFRDIDKAVWLRFWVLPDPMVDWSHIE